MDKTWRNKNRTRQNTHIQKQRRQNRVKKLPSGRATLAAGATGAEGFAAGADGFFSSGRDTLKYKMPNSRPRQQHGQSRQTVVLKQCKIRLKTQTASGIAIDKR